MPVAQTRVAFQGVAGAFSEEAVFAAFGPSAVAVPYYDFPAVGNAVLEGEVDAGLLPVENSVAGSVTGAYDVLAGAELEVVGEVILPIRHCVMGLEGAQLARLKRIVSHPVALAQCGRFLSGQPQIEAVAVYDTAGAARQVAADSEPAQAAIAGHRAAHIYGLSIIEEDVQDRADNQTRFLALVRRMIRPTQEHREQSGPDPRDSLRIRRDIDELAVPPAEPPNAARAAAWKSIVLATTDNRPGALVGLLTAFADYSINLTKIESRPGQTPWTYRFFLELEGDARAADVESALERARKRSNELTVLGSFTMATNRPEWVEEASNRHERVEEAERGSDR